MKNKRRIYPLFESEVTCVIFSWEVTVDSRSTKIIQENNIVISIIIKINMLLNNVIPSVRHIISLS